MAFTQTPANRAFSLGTTRQQRISFQAQSGDTTATLTFTSLNRVGSVAVSCLVLTAITYNGDNTATITFIDPAATVVGVAEGHGP